MITTGVVLVVVPLVVVALSFLFQGDKLSHYLRENLIEAAYEDMDARLEFIFSEVGVAKHLLDTDIKKVIEVGSLVLEKVGGIQIDDTEEKIGWRAANQYNGRSEQFELPVMRLGNGQTILPEKSLNTAVPVVDEIRDLTGDTATIFQRMNDSGDLLRIATNVDNGGRRAVGTYIPAVNPDGSPNAVVRTVLSGRDYVGRAFVVNQWYVTVYRPLFGPNGQVIGVLYVGTPERTATDNMLDKFAEFSLGDSGYIFVLNTKGKDAGRYVLSQSRSRDGEVILGAKDSEGKEFVREMVETARGLESGEFRTVTYPFKSPGEAAVRMKVSRYGYFPEWDWLIGIGTYQEELYGQAEYVDGVIDSISRLILIICVLSAAIAAFIFTGLTGRVVKRIEKIIKGLEGGSGETTDAANEVSSASQNLASGASQQAASLEQAHASMESMNELVGRNAEVAKKTREDTVESNKNATKGVESMQVLLQSIQRSSKAVLAMSEVIAQIKNSSNAVSKIISKIDDIAFQTNILALNASVEAARAGESGAGFAVVAEEVSNLAGRAAEAAKETAALIDDSVKRSEDGVAASDQVSEYLGSVEEGSKQANQILEEIVESIRRIAESMTTIETNSQEQHSGIGQLTDLVANMNSVTQQNAASAEQTASASEELNAQAISLREIVEDLSGVVSGSSKKDSGHRMQTMAIPDSKPSLHLR